VPRMDGESDTHGCKTLKPPGKSPEAGLHAVRPAGLEPAAHSLGNCCSIHLSYGRETIPQYNGHTRRPSPCLIPACAVAGHGRGDGAGKIVPLRESMDRGKPVLPDPRREGFEARRQFICRQGLRRRCWGAALMCGHLMRCRLSCHRLPRSRRTSCPRPGCRRAPASDEGREQRAADGSGGGTESGSGGLTGYCGGRRHVPDSWRGVVDHGAAFSVWAGDAWMIRVRSGRRKPGQRRHPPVRMLAPTNTCRPGAGSKYRAPAAFTLTDPK
jgi:hypothetical protein